MTWIQDELSESEKKESGTVDLESVLALRSPLATKFADFTASFASDGSVSPTILALCRSHVRWVHGLEPEPPSANSQAQRIALDVASKMPFGHHDISDDEVGKLAEHFGEAGAVNLLTAVAMYDATARMERVLGVA